MAITIDSISPNSTCIDEYKKDTPSPGALPKPCEIDVKVGLSDRENSSYTFRFIKEGIRFRLSNSSNAVDVSLLMQSGWNPEDPNLQALLLQSIPLSWVWEVNYQERYLKSKENLPIQNADELFQLLSDYLGFGSFQEGANPKRQENFSKILNSIAALNSNQKKFMQENLGSQLQEVKRLHSGVVERMQVLKGLADWSLAFDSSFALLMGDDDVAKVLRNAEKELLGHLFLSNPDFEKIKNTLRIAALEVQKGEVNFYEKLLPLLQNLESDPSLKTQSLLQTRITLLKQWIAQPVRAQELKYGALSEQEAMEQSILDSLSSAEGHEMLAKNVLEILAPPQLEAEWFGSNGNLKEMVHAIFSSVKIVEDKEGKLSLDAQSFKTLGFTLTNLMSQHGIQEREFAGGILACLIQFFGNPPQSPLKLKLFWKGELKEREIALSSDQIQELQSSDRILRLRIKSSLQNTQTLLPWLETGACLTGLGGTAWGVARSRDSGTYIDPVMLSGSGLAGFSCGALATHFLYPTRNAYISDALGGVGGLLLGLGIPLLLEYKKSNPDFSGTRPIEGRNPTTEWGP